MECNMNRVKIMLADCKGDNETTLDLLEVERLKYKTIDNNGGAADAIIVWD